MKNYNLHFSKRCCTLGFALAMLFGLLLPKQVAAQTTDTYNFTGAMQTWVVPPGVTSVFIQSWGAQGGTANPGGTGGLGGYAEGNLVVTPGQVLNIFVGSQTGFNGGGTGGINGNTTFGGPPIGNAPSGGGASDVRVDGIGLGDRVIVAGGGGGAGQNGTWPGCQVAGPAGDGGAGGGLNGTFGVGTPCNCGGGGGDLGTGGTQASGGPAGGYHGNTACLRFSWTIGSNGTLGQGGNGSLTWHNGTGGGGGGGGGYYGGGSGGSGSDTTPGGGGGGGSNFVGGVTSGTTNNGIRLGNGQVAITYTVNPLTCPADLTVAACQTQAAVDDAFDNWVGTVQVESGCIGGIVTVDVGAPPACGGTSVATFTLTGNSCSPATPVTCTANFTVAFPDDIVLSGCPPPAVQLACNPNIPSCAVVPAPALSGGCNPVLVCLESPITNTSACERTRTLTWTATDNCNQSTSCSTVYTWTEATAPVFSNCNNATINLGCNPTQVPTNCTDMQFPAFGGAVTASNECGPVMVTCDTNTVFAGCARSRTFTFTAAACGLTSTCTRTFTWAQESPITLNCPQPTQTDTCLTQDQVNALYATWLASASFTGGCNPNLTNNSGNLGAPSSCGGSRTIIFTVIDECGSPLTCTSTFTVPAAPTVVLNCPINTTVASCQTQAAINAQFSAWLNAANASGGCNGTLTNDNIGAPSSCGGNTVVTFTYTNSCAPLTTTCTATFTVAAPPMVVLTCPVNTTVSACLTQAQLNNQYAAWLASVSASGGCNGVITNNSQGVPQICNLAGSTTTVTFTYTSSCFPFSTSCNATFTVQPYPVFTVPANTASTVACPALIVQPVPPVVLDGCGKTLTPTGPVIVNSPNPITCEGTRTFTWTYTDCAGTVRTWSHVTTVERLPFTVPANGAATVACPANATQPVPPVVLSNCGETITPTGPVVTNVPNPLTCEGTRTYTWTYTDCEGNTLPWSFTYTIERQPFTIAAQNGSATVACPDNTDVVPVPPVVTSNCGEILTPVRTETPKPLCEGTRTYTFTYTDCEGNSAQWRFTYTVEYQDFIIPTSIVGGVECPVNVFVPTPPAVNDNCGNPLVPVGPTVTSTTNAQGCEASRKYEWIYTDCEGNSHTWSQTFLFEYNGDFFAPADEENYVTCLAYAVQPVPQTLYDYCGLPIAANLVGVTEDIAAGGCTGWRKYSFVYTDCGGHSHPWSFTYYINDNEGPLGTCPSGSGSGGSVAVNVSNLSCIEDVPCPDDYDFMPKVEELLEAGNYFDVCDGANVIVTLDSYSDLWECADPDGDGDYTFGRTFYFRIADKCGNEYSSLCEVTYSGACQPLTSFPQEAWGVEGGAPGNSISSATTDLSVIATLLSGGPMAIGGSARSIILTDAQCVMNLLPGTSGPAMLASCQQTNCTGPNGTGCNPLGVGGMKNTLAANAITLELNVRYNVQYNSLSRSGILGQSLACIPLHPCIYRCSSSGDCLLHLFDAQGVEHTAAYTIGGLQDLVNLYLNGALEMTVGQQVIYGTALNQSLLSLNGYFAAGVAASACGSVAPDFSDVDKLFEEYNLDSSDGTVSVKPSLELMPNPAFNEVTVKLKGLMDGKPVSMEIHNALGQKLMYRAFGEVGFINERLDLQALDNGIYFVSIMVGEERFERKLVVSKD